MPRMWLNKSTYTMAYEYKKNRVNEWQHGLMNGTPTPEQCTSDPFQLIVHHGCRGAIH
jgi:hypothetical protein